MALTFKEVKKAEKNGRLQESIEHKRWKKPITELLEKEKKFLSAGEIRNSLGVNSHIYPHIRYLKISGTLVTKIVDNKAYYGLKEWEDVKKQKNNL